MQDADGRGANMVVAFKNECGLNIWWWLCPQKPSQAQLPCTEPQLMKGHQESYVKRFLFFLYIKKLSTRCPEKSFLC